MFIGQKTDLIIFIMNLGEINTSYQMLIITMPFDDKTGFSVQSSLPIIN